MDKDEDLAWLQYRMPDETTKLYVYTMIMSTNRFNDRQDDSYFRCTDDDLGIFSSLASGARLGGNVHKDVDAANTTSFKYICTDVRSMV